MGGVTGDHAPVPPAAEVSPKNVRTSWLNWLLISSMSRYGPQRYTGVTLRCPLPRYCLEVNGASVIVRPFLSRWTRYPDRRHTRVESVSPDGGECEARRDKE